MQAQCINLSLTGVFEYLDILHSAIWLALDLQFKKCGRWRFVGFIFVVDNVTFHDYMIYHLVVEDNFIFKDQGIKWFLFQFLCSNCSSIWRAFLVHDEIGVIDFIFYFQDGVNISQLRRFILSCDNYWIIQESLLWKGYIQYHVFLFLTTAKC